MAYGSDRNRSHMKLGSRNFQTARMSEVQVLDNIISWSEQSKLTREGRSEFDDLVNGRSMKFAPVDNPRSFCADMKDATGRLMDFNKGMLDACWGICIA